MAHALLAHRSAPRRPGSVFQVSERRDNTQLSQSQLEKEWQKGIRTVGLFHRKLSSKLDTIEELYRMSRVRRAGEGFSLCPGPPEIRQHRLGVARLAARL